MNEVLAYRQRQPQTISTDVTFSGNKATIVIDDKTFTVTSERFREPIEKCAIGHFSETLHTKDVTIHKSK